MFGTGESPSSSSESMTPSTMSRSSTRGTYCSHIGSPTSLICSRAAGVIRIWKLSNAGTSASTSMTSWPNLSASFSRLAMLWSRRVFCQSLMVTLLRPSRGNGEPFGEDDPIVGWRVEVAHCGGFAVPTREIERPRRGIIGSGRCFDDQHPGVQSRQPSLDLREESGSAAGALHGRIDCDPVQIPGAIRVRRGAVAGIADQLIFRGEGAEEDVAVEGKRGFRSVRERGSGPHLECRCARAGSERRGRERLVEQLERDADLRRPKDTGSAEDLRDTVALGDVDAAGANLRAH